MDQFKMRPNEMHLLWQRQMDALGLFITRDWLRYALDTLSLPPRYPVDRDRMHELRPRGVLQFGSLRLQT